MKIALQKKPACACLKIISFPTYAKTMKSLLLIPLAIGSLIFTSCATQSAACAKCMKASCCENCAKPGGCKTDCKCCNPS